VLDWTDLRGGDNVRQVVWANFVDATSVLDDFVITAGNADSPYIGAGLYSYQGNPTLRHLVMRGNKTYWEGGGACFQQAAAVAMEDVSFIVDAYDGGGLNLGRSRTA
jgi:hypothetical protein